VTTTEVSGYYPKLAFTAPVTSRREQLELAFHIEQDAFEYGRGAQQHNPTLKQLEREGLLVWSPTAYYLTDRGRWQVLNLVELDAHAEHERREMAAGEGTEVIDAIPAAEQTGIIPAEGTLAEPTVEATLPGRHRIVKRRRTPGWLLVAYLAVLAAVDRLLTRVSYRIARFVTLHARGLAWFVLATPALAAGLVLGTCGVLWVIR
jgi:hypothetical protein